ncbi:MAG: cytoskeletal protein CcmA (bactofilin family) [Verrucomicrobiales bacterium]|jgi:cytoskeletal protein CcmA (bactofilin family)
MNQSRNILSNDVKITGTLKCAQDLIIDGEIDGEVKCDAMLTIGENARLKAQVDAKSVTVFGHVEGNINATEKCDLKPTGVVQGDVSAGRLSMEDGATFMGSAKVGAAAKKP